MKSICWGRAPHGLVVSALCPVVVSLLVSICCKEAFMVGAVAALICRP